MDEARYGAWGQRPDPYELLSKWNGVGETRIGCLGRRHRRRPPDYRVGCYVRFGLAATFDTVSNQHRHTWDTTIITGVGRAFLTQ